MDHYRRTMFGEALGHEPFFPMSSTEIVQLTLKYVSVMCVGVDDFDRKIAGIDFHECLYQFYPEELDTISGRMWIGADQAAAYTLLVDYDDRGDIKIAVYCLPSGSTHVSQTIQLFDFRLSSTKEGNGLLQAMSFVPELEELIGNTIRRIGQINEDAANEVISQYSQYREISVSPPPIKMPAFLRSLVSHPENWKFETLTGDAYHTAVD